MKAATKSRMLKGLYLAALLTITIGGVAAHAANPVCRIAVSISNTSNFSSANVISIQNTDRAYVPEFLQALQSPYVNPAVYCRDWIAGDGAARLAKACQNHMEESFMGVNSLIKNMPAQVRLNVSYVSATGATTALKTLVSYCQDVVSPAVKQAYMPCYSFEKTTSTWVYTCGSSDGP